MKKDKKIKQKTEKNSKNNTPYIIDYFNVNDIHWAIIIYCLIFFSCIALLLLFAFTTMVIYTAIVSDADKYNLQIFAENLDGSAVLFSTTLTACLTIIMGFLNHRLKIAFCIVNKILELKHRRFIKKYGVNTISDASFSIANEIISYINSEDKSSFRFYSICAPNKIDHFELVYAIYLQLYETQDKHIALDKKIKHIILYDFSFASGTKNCKELLESYKSVNRFSDVIIIVNRNYLALDDQIKIHNNFNSKYTLANSIYELNDRSTLSIKPTLDAYEIQPDEILKSDKNNPIVIILIILDSVFGYIPYSALKDIFLKKDKTKVLSYVNKEALFGKKFKISGQKAFKLNRERAEAVLHKKLSQTFEPFNWDKYIKEKLLCYLYKKSMPCAHLEISALIGVFNDDTEKAINDLLDKDCFNAALQRVNLYSDSCNDIKFLIYLAIIEERGGSIKQANHILSLIKNMPITVSDDGMLKYSYSNAKDIDNKLLGKFAFVLFENTHGIVENKSIILDFIENKIENLDENEFSDDKKMYKYWKLHINLENGKFNPTDYCEWIKQYKENYQSNRNKYRYLHNLRRVYSDYANCVYLTVLERYSDDNIDTICESMLSTVSDRKLTYDLLCYRTHMYRMAVGDLIMNYCLPTIVIREKEIPAKIQAFLKEQNYVEDVSNTEELSDFALEIYNRCRDDFHLRKDKSEKTTNTRVCAMLITHPPKNVDYFKIDEKIKEFYINSNFEVFKSYGIAMRIKLNLLQYFETNESLIYNLCENDEIGKDKISELERQYDEKMEKHLSKIVGLYEELLDFGFSKFSDYSRNRFKMLFSYLCIFRKAPKISKELLENIDKITKEFSSVKCFGIEEGIVSKILCIDNASDSSSNGTSIKKLKDILRFYPIILL